MEIEAEQFTGDNVAEVWETFGTDGIYGPTEQHPNQLVLTTLHGDPAPCRPGDWVVPEPVAGRFYPIKDDVFRRKYEEIT